MYIGVYDTSAQNHHLKEVNLFSNRGHRHMAHDLHAVLLRPWGIPSVSMPNVMYNIYYMNTDYKSKHFHYTMAMVCSPARVSVMPGGGHYGIVDTDDHKVSAPCHWSSTSYCNQGTQGPHLRRRRPLRRALLGVLADDRGPDHADFRRQHH